MPIRCARGTKDVLPAEIPTWHFLEDLARDLAEDYGYREIRTPEIAEQVRMTAGTVCRALSRVREKLRECIRRSLEGEGGIHAGV